MQKLKRKSIQKLMKLINSVFCLNLNLKWSIQCFLWYASHFTIERSAFKNSCFRAIFRKLFDLIVFSSNIYLFFYYLMNYYYSKLRGTHRMINEKKWEISQGIQYPLVRNQSPWHATVVFFDQSPGAPHAICGSKSFVSALKQIFSPGVDQLLGVNQLLRVTPKCW